MKRKQTGWINSWEGYECHGSQGCPGEDFPINNKQQQYTMEQARVGTAVSTADFCLTGWEDNALRTNPHDYVSKDNIIPYPRYHYRSTRKKLDRLQLENIEPVNPHLSIGKLPPDSSNFQELKKRMRSIERDDGRWHVQNRVKSMLKEKAFFGRAQSGLIKSKLLGDNSYVESGKKMRSKVRPTSSSGETLQSIQAYRSLEKEKVREEAIHNKSCMKVPFLKYTKSRKKNKIIGNLQICINQLQNSKMERVLRCLAHLK